MKECLRSRRLTEGSLKTLEFTIKHRKPYLHLSAIFKEHAVSGLKQWMRENNIHVLNIAGPGASKAPTVAEFVIATLDAAFKP